MKILEIKVMRGPNYWSVKHKALIVLKIDIGDLSSEKIENFIEDALIGMPFLSEKFHIETYLDNKIAQVIKYVALELQSRIGTDYTFSKIQQVTGENQYYIIYPYELEEVSIHAGEAAVRIAEAILEKRSYNIQAEIDELKFIKSRYSMGPTNKYILEEIKRRDIPYRQFDQGSLLLLGYGHSQKKIRTAVTDSTSGLGMEMASDKEETKRILDDAHIPIPHGTLIYSEEKLLEYLRDVKFPIVIKPLNGNHGRGVTTNINSVEGALFGFNIAKQVSEYIIVEEYIKGNDYRLLVINYKLIAVAKRIPAFVKGDGRSTIGALIEEENKNPDRAGGDSVLAPIKVDEITQKILTEKHFTVDHVLDAGEVLILKDTANISAGGTAEDVTESVHPENKFLAEHIARMFNLDICGIDIMATAIDVPLTRDTGAIIEVNAGPGLRMHSNPQKGTPRNVAEPIIKMLFPQIHSSRIPIVAVAGVNVKTIVYLIAEMAKRGGYKPGYNTEDGIYIDGHKIYSGDCTGYVSAQDVLFDPLINCAIIECNSDGISRSGLGFDHCNISIIANAANGSKDDLFSSDHVAKVISVVGRSTFANGSAILNADDDLVYAMAEQLDCKIVLFSLSPESNRIKTHRGHGGLAAVVEDNYITVYKGDQKKSLFKLKEDADKMKDLLKNILPAVLTAVVSRFKKEDIIDTLDSYVSQDLIATETD